LGWPRNFAPSGTVAKTDLAADDLAALRESKDAKIKAHALALLGPAASREKIIAEYQPALTLQGDPAKGHSTFLARCTICHRIRDEGNAVGPDLAASAAAGREKLLGNILDPNRDITAGFSTVTVETKSGEILTGITLAENDGAVTLRMPGGPLRVLARVEIASLEHSSRSLMPEGLEAGLGPQDLADLLEFLSTK
jgi:putative heme-binding domain-containing protein